jgi:hypothetical protein
MTFICRFCGKEVKSKKGLRQHIDGKPDCLAREKKEAGLVDVATLRNLQSVASIPKKTHRITDACHEFDYSIFGDLLDSPEKGHVLPKAKRQRRFPDIESPETGRTGKSIDAMAHKILGNFSEKTFHRLLDKFAPVKALFSAKNDERLTEDEAEPTSVMEESSEDELVIVGGPEEDEVSVNSNAQAEIAVPPPNPPEVHAPDYNHDLRINMEPNTKMRDDFKKYCREKQLTRSSFSISEERAVKLMGVLKGTRAALSTYDAILDWHHRDKGDISERETLQHVNNVDQYHSRKSMIKKLAARYFLTNKEPRNVTVELPNSKATVQLTFHSAWDCIESLLTDPRVTDQDYNFHGNDPLAAPPPIEANSMIGELNTGKAYLAAYKKFIKFPGKQVLLPIVFYIDGAVTGHFSDLPITALKLALGIHTRNFRNKEMAWRTLGYVATISTASSRAKNLLLESGHLEAEYARISEAERGADTTEDACKAQDFHTMLQHLLASYVDVQEKGFMWDLRYRGKTYKDIEFVPFVIFVKADTDEADVLCGSYKSRTAGVAQLCRYCTCPTRESDLVFAAYPPKTVQMIQELVEAQNFDGLKQLSQQMIQNAWYKIRFHPYNKQGIHGACPSEMLHALLLGVFKYTRECFFEQIGPTSKLAKDINGLAKQYGDFFQRQSERNAPKCQFYKGIVEGKTTAKEFVGILLVMAAVLRSRTGRDLLSVRKETFGDPEFYKDWVDLVERLLQWEAFLNEPEMLTRNVVRLRLKNRYIMWQIKKVLKRTTGMGLKLIKFHVIIHMWMDIYLYGVPSEVDTGSNESHHKVTKIAAKLTQKNETTFDFQTCTRLDEFFMIELALAELNDDLKLWDYFSKPADPDDEVELPDPPKTCGTKIRVFKDEKLGSVPQYSMGEGKKAREPCLLEWNDDLVRFLYKLQVKLQVKCLSIRGEHRREGLVFRGHPNYREKQWKDWAYFDWGQEEDLPCQIWCFVIIDFDPEVATYHGGVELEKGTYAVVECANYDTREGEKTKSALFVPILKEVARRKSHQHTWKRKFYLANVEAITDTLMVIPNIGGKLQNEYLIMKTENEWIHIFKNWLEAGHDKDTIPLTEPVPVHNCLRN